eukprot:1322776-Amorphochlora_amoeboformis.AAC.1
MPKASPSRVCHTSKAQLDEDATLREKENGARCAICLENDRTSSEARLDCCTHTFHTECIKQWGEKGKNCCPLCQKRFRQIIYNSRYTRRSRKIRVEHKNLELDESSDEDNQEHCVTCCAGLVNEDPELITQCPVCQRLWHNRCVPVHNMSVWFCTRCVHQQAQAHASFTDSRQRFEDLFADSKPTIEREEKLQVNSQRSQNDQPSMKPSRMDSQESESSTSSWWSTSTVDTSSSSTNGHQSSSSKRQAAEAQLPPSCTLLQPPRKRPKSIP